MTLLRHKSLSYASPRRFMLEMAITFLAVFTAIIVVTNHDFLLIALCIGLAALGVLRFNWFLYATVFLLPWYPFIEWKLPVRDVFLLAHFALFAGMLVLQQYNGIPLRDWVWKGWLRKGMLGFASIAALSLLISQTHDADGAAKALAKLLSYTAVFLTVAGWATSRERIQRILQILLVSTIGVCLFGFCQMAVGGFTSFYFGLYPDMEPVLAAQGGWDGRITSFLFHYNSLAGYLNAVIPFALAIAVLGQHRWMRRLAFLCLAFSFAALFLTSSRGGLIACAVVLLLTLYLLVPRRRMVAVVLGALLIAAGMVSSLLSGKAAETQSDRLQSVDEFTMQSRLALWGAAGVIFLEHPVLGSGFGTYRFAFQQYVPGIEDQLDAHNLFLQTLAETGVVGFVVFFMAQFLFIRTGFRLTKSRDPLWRTVGLGVLGAVTATLVHGGVDYIFIASPQFGNLFWLLLALGVAAEAQAQPLTEEPSFNLQEAGSPA